VTEPDIRWQQRLDNYGRALKQLRAAVALAAERKLSELEQCITQRYAALFESFAVRMEGLRRA